MIANILFFIGWTLVISWFTSRQTRKCVEMIKNYEDVLKNNKIIYDEGVAKLKLRSEQNDVLMQTINNLNKQLNDKNEEGLTFLENFSGLLGKQYLFLQDDGTYYNRYTGEYMTEEDAEHWLYSELSEVINK